MIGAGGTIRGGWVGARESGRAHTVIYILCKIAAAAEVAANSSGWLLLHALGLPGDGWMLMSGGVV